MSLLTKKLRKKWKEKGTIWRGDFVATTCIREQTTEPCLSRGKEMQSGGKRRTGKKKENCIKFDVCGIGKRANLFLLFTRREELNM